jgi:hypothetical protein
VFGEPDVRIHFDKQINILKRNEDDVIRILVLKYINKIVDITPNNIKIVIRYVLPQRENSMFGKWLPNGMLRDRVRYTNKLNTKLEQICNEKNILFLNNSKRCELVEEDGSLKNKYCDGTTHYNDNSVPLIDKEIIEFLHNQNN